MYFVHDILDHKKDPKTKHDLHKVRWAGFGPYNDDWLPAADIGELLVRRYLQSVNRLPPPTKHTAATYRVSAQGTFQHTTDTEKASGEIQRVSHKRKQADAQSTFSQESKITTVFTSKPGLCATQASTPHNLSRRFPWPGPNGTTPRVAHTTPVVPTHGQTEDNRQSNGLITRHQHTLKPVTQKWQMVQPQYVGTCTPRATRESTRESARVP